MKYRLKHRLKTDPDVTVEVCDFDGQDTVEIPTSVFKAAFERAPQNDRVSVLKELLKNWPSE
jgi:hypothetical protein